MSFRKGQRVSENGRKGTVKAIHTKGTVDVMFDDMDYAIRRQAYNVSPLRSNPTLQQRAKQVRGIPADFDLTELQFIAQVMGIYRSNIAKALGLRYSDIGDFFDVDGNRIDSDMTPRERREILNDSFAQATGFQRQHGYLADSFDDSKPTPRVPTIKALKRVYERMEDPSDVRDTVDFYEQTLAMARTGKRPSASDTGIRIEKDSNGYILLYNGGIVDIDGVKRWKLKKDLVSALKRADFIVKNNNEVFQKPNSKSVFTEK